MLICAFCEPTVSGAKFAPVCHQADSKNTFDTASTPEYQKLHTKNQFFYSLFIKIYAFL